LIAGESVPEIAINAVIDEILFNASSLANRTGSMLQVLMPRCCDKARPCHRI